MRVAPGTKIGRYTVEALLGAGGMGEVYLARDPELDRLVALKLLSGEAKGDSDFELRLRSEARAASALNHPNILTVHEIGEANGEHFIATEYVDGVTLRQHVGALPLLDAVRISERIAEALAAAEAAGVVHRDVKPDNVMVRRDGYVKVLDFGLARRVLPSQQLHQTDVTGLRGTVHYMSPEQLRAQPLDSRTDVWSFGVLLFELVTGHRPFEGDHAATIIAAVLSGEPVMDDVPPLLRRIIGRALQKDREQRFATMAALLQALQQLRRQLETSSAPTVMDTPAPFAESDDFAPITSRTRRPAGNLPVLLTSVVGREDDLDRLRALLASPEVRLVTITGPGGVGKTRLALQLARDIEDRFSGGAFFVSLASVSDPDMVLDAVAATLGIREDAGGSLAATMARELQHTPVLLVLDNLEQVIECGPALSVLLEHTRALKIITTSQASLRVRGEVDYPLGPLPLPDAGDDLPVLAGNPAVSLFVDRARANDSRFALTRENAASIAAICKLLDGLPLAIELAAARVKLMAPRTIVSRLSDPLAFLTGGSRDLPSRQQTMHDAIAWGYELLSDDERRLLAIVGVFAGGFTLEAVESVCKTVTRNDPADALQGLVERSFVRRDTVGEEIRFSLLGTIRDYALRRLASEPDERAVRLAHAEYFAALAEAAGNELQGARQKHWMRLVERELANIESATQWALEQQRADLALRLSSSPWWYWYITGRYNAARRAIESALATSTAADGALRGRALLAAGVLAFLQCDYAIASTHLEGAERAAASSGDETLAADANQFLGSIAREKGEYGRALERHHKALDHWKSRGDRTRVARSLNYISFASWLSGDCSSAIPAAEEAMRIFEQTDDGEGIAWSRINLAAAATCGRDDESALRVGKQALATARELGFKEGIAWALNILGVVTRRRGQLERAEGFLRRSLRDHWELGDRWRASSVLDALAGVLADQGDRYRAARLLLAARALRESIGTPVPVAERESLGIVTAALANELEALAGSRVDPNSVVIGEIFEAPSR